MEIKVPETLKKLASFSEFPVYITGGYLRNQICGLGKTDIDLCGPVVATALGLPKNCYIKTVNFRLGTSVIRFENEEYEYTPFRTENYSEGGAHTPSNVGFTSDIRVDARRRDFCCNSLYYDIKKGELLDFSGGVADCQNKILRAKNPEEVFSSDGLRLMRLCRIAAETGFKIEGKTGAAAMKNSHLLKDISPERKREELMKVLNADVKYGVENAHYRGLKLMQKLGLFKFVIPRLAECEGVEQNPEYHKYDVLEHIFQTVKAAEPEVRLAALFHDIGKPYCKKTFDKMHGHEVASARAAKETLGQFGLKFPNETVDETERLCRYHMYDMNSLTSEGKVRLFIAHNFDIVDKLVKLIKADRAGSGMREVPEKHRFEIIKEQMLSDGTPIEQTDLAINGVKLLEMGYKGPAIGKILTEMHDKCILDPHLNNEEWLTSYAQKHLNDEEKK